MRQTAIIAALLATLAPALTPAAARAETSTGTFVQERLSLPRMELVDHNARTRDLTGELTEGAIVVISFNYTLCTSICPIGNDVMAEVDARIDSVGGRPLRLLSITIDPTHDTPLLLHEAARSFGASDKWTWLTGDPHDIASLLRAVDAEAIDIELHAPVFLVGDVGRGLFYRSLTLPTADELIDRIADFGT